jgi:hypothetical protein
MSFQCQWVLEGSCRGGAISFSVNCTIPAGGSHTTKVGPEGVAYTVGKPLPAVHKLKFDRMGVWQPSGFRPSRSEVFGYDRRIGTFLSPR